MSSFSIKRGDTSPTILYTLSPKVNLSGATVVFNMRGLSGPAVVDRGPAEIVGDPMDAVVSYAWQPGDTAQAGYFRAEFEVTYADGSVETFPNAEFIGVNIGRDLG